MPDSYEQLQHAADQLEHLASVDFQRLADDVRRGDEDALVDLDVAASYLRQAWDALVLDVRSRRFG